MGKCCESRDPHLAYVAYKRGECDQELIEVCNKHGFYKPQARYLVERAHLELWKLVLAEETEHRRALIDEVKKDLWIILSVQFNFVLEASTRKNLFKL